MLHAFWDGILDLIYPRPINCLYCNGEMSPADYELCRECISAIEFIKSSGCNQCGKPVTTGAVYCGDCSGQKFIFEKVLPVAVYRGWLKDAIYAFKFCRQQGLAKPFARMMAGRITAEGYEFDIIVPVPMHPERILQRGYNHSALLAEFLGQFLRIPVRSDALYRDVDTIPQRLLTRSEREKNLINVFSVRKENVVKNKRILLVDDIYTTGFTAQACSAVLINKGAISVVVGILAIGLDKSRILSKLTE
jgi:competence protein ComFC